MAGQGVGRQDLGVGRIEVERIAVELARREGAYPRVALEVGGVEVAVAGVRLLHHGHALALEGSQPGGGAAALLVAEKYIARGAEVVVAQRPVEPVDRDRLAVGARTNEARAYSVSLGAHVVSSGTVDFT